MSEVNLCPKACLKRNCLHWAQKQKFRNEFMKKKCFKGHNCLHWAQICEFTVINIVHCLKIQFEQVVNLCPTVI